VGCISRFTVFIFVQSCFLLTAPPLKSFHLIHAEILTACESTALPTIRARERRPERLKKYCSHSERGFLGSGEALAKEQVLRNPVTEPKRSQNPKRPLFVPSDRMATVFLKML